ncbi:MAG: DUF1667 domain-containing protein [Kosmotoga sp.]|nr:MAG: DUF1667 domain-containing protein [Kosmotoga sp.]
MKGHITCTVCPVGCKIFVSDESGEIVIEGNRCERGYEYAMNEIVRPKRTLPTSVKVIGGNQPLVSVKSSKPIDLKKIADIMEKIKSIAVKAPVRIGDVVVDDIDGEGTSLIATRNVNKVQEK